MPARSPPDLWVAPAGLLHSIGVCSNQCHQPGDSLGRRFFSGGSRQSDSDPAYTVTAPETSHRIVQRAARNAGKASKSGVCPLPNPLRDKPRRKMNVPVKINETGSHPAADTGRQPLTSLPARNKCLAGASAARSSAHGAATGPVRDVPPSFAPPPLLPPPVSVSLTHCPRLGRLSPVPALGLSSIGPRGTDWTAPRCRQPARSSWPLCRTAACRPGAPAPPHGRHRRRQVRGSQYRAAPPRHGHRRRGQITGGDA